MNLFQALILGVIQGVAELLPISSSAHLVLFPWMSGWEAHPLSFDCFLHLGTLAAVLLYFRREWLALLHQGALSITEKTLDGPPERRLFWYIVIASLPACIAGAVFLSAAESVFRNPLLIAATLAIFGILLYASDRTGRHDKTMRQLTLKDILMIGFAQAIAIIPGVSRSGITITAALGSGLDRETAARFSFLLAMPVILGASVVEAGKIIGMGAGGAWPNLFAGFLAAMTSGLLSIRFLLGYLKRRGFEAFALYRVLLALVISILYFIQ